MTTISSTLRAASPIDVKSPVQLQWINLVLSNRLANHILFWVLVFIFNIAYITFIEEDRVVSLYNFGLRIPFILACCYINLYWLMPRYYSKGKLLLYAMMVLLMIFSLNAFNLLLLEQFVETPICPTTFEADATFNGSNYIYKSFYLFSIVGLTSGIKLSREHLAEKQRTDAVEKEKLQTELSLLKSQVNPHFFFNTLNSLYALTIKKSDDAPGMVLKLSELMSYSLYESEEVRVSLWKEISHIENYIALEKVRLGNKMTVNFKTSGIREDRPVPPLIFLPLIENCFKHGAALKPGMIDIELIERKNSILLKTSNPVVEQVKTLNVKGGLGLRNVQRRLELLYGSEYRLETETNNGFFTATLEIPFA